jgi:hypothetical protein
MKKIITLNVVCIKLISSFLVVFPLETVKTSRNTLYVSCKVSICYEVG